MHVCVFESSSLKNDKVLLIIYLKVTSGHVPFPGVENRKFGIFGGLIGHMESLGGLNSSSPLKYS